tara:strand:+ start:645 stop:902 length:258 start_codon:yes stop_codon:yes gene_type:complete
MLLDKKKIDVWFISDLFECLENCRISGSGNGWISISNKDNTLVDYYEDTRFLCVYIENIDNKTYFALEHMCTKYNMTFTERTQDE